MITNYQIHQYSTQQGDKNKTENWKCALESNVTECSGCCLTMVFAIFRNNPSESTQKEETLKSVQIM